MWFCCGRGRGCPAMLSLTPHRSVPMWPGPGTSASLGSVFGVSHFVLSLHTPASHLRRLRGVGQSLFTAASACEGSRASLAGEPPALQSPVPG